MEIYTRKNFIKKIAAASSLPFLFSGFDVFAAGQSGNDSLPDPTECDYAPPGEYIKDHCFVYHDGWYHLFSISGIQGYYHGYTGNEETISWSISKDLVNWEMRGHILHASQRKGAFDQHAVWAPFCYQAKDGFYMFYTGIVHPHRPMTYGKATPDHVWIYEGHKETIGLAVSKDMTDWVKYADVENGLGIYGRDPHVVWNEEDNEYLLYSTGPSNRDGLCQAFVSRSKDLINWNFWGLCALFPGGGGNAESLFVQRHPISNKWIIMANYHYALSDNPLSFLQYSPREYDTLYNGKTVSMGFAGEILEHQGKVYRSGVTGKPNYTRLCFTEIEWVDYGAFRVKKPGKTLLP